MMTRPSFDIVSLLPLASLFFIIGDLYFAYNDHTCTRSWVVESNFGIGLGTWLKVSGYTSILFIVFTIVNVFLMFCAPLLIILQFILVAIFTLFRFIWLVIGAFIFWGYLWRSGTCAPGLSLYMWISLIYGIFVIFCLGYQRQNTYTTSYVQQRSIV